MRRTRWEGGRMDVCLLCFVYIVCWVCGGGWEDNRLQRQKKKNTSANDIIVFLGGGWVWWCVWVVGWGGGGGGGGGAPAPSAPLVSYLHQSGMSPNLILHSVFLVYVGRLEHRELLDTSWEGNPAHKETVL